MTPRPSAVGRELILAGCPPRMAANLAHPGAPTASPILAALRSTHERETLATPPPSGSVPHGLKPDARHGLPRPTEPLEAGSETAPQSRKRSGERLGVVA